MLHLILPGVIFECSCTDYPFADFWILILFFSSEAVKLEAMAAVISGCCSRNGHSLSGSQVLGIDM